MLLRAVDSIVVADVEIGGIRTDIKLILLRHVMEAGFLTRRRNLTNAQDSCLFVGIAGEGAAEDIVALLLR